MNVLIGTLIGQYQDFTSPGHLKFESYILEATHRNASLSEVSVQSIPIKLILTPAQSGTSLHKKSPLPPRFKRGFLKKQL